MTTSSYALAMICASAGHGSNAKKKTTLQSILFFLKTIPRFVSGGWAKLLFSSEHREPPSVFDYRLHDADGGTMTKDLFLKNINIVLAVCSWLVRNMQSPAVTNKM